MADDPVIVAVGDSALWTTGTRYEDKTPNLVHEKLKGGEPIEPSHFRARGGAVIGLSRRYKDSPGNRGSRNRWNRSPDYYHFKEDSANWYTFYDPNRDRSGDSRDDLAPGESGYNDVNRLKWTVARDIGSPYPTVVQQIEQFPRRSNGENASNARWQMDVPGRPVKQLGGANAETTPPYAEDVDLLLINGGTNDISLEWLNDYRVKSRDDVLAATRRHCYRDQVDLLRAARNRFPNAVIALVGYFPFLSDGTDYSRARGFLKRQIGGFKATFAAIERVVDHALVFARAHQHFMRKAVAERAREEADDGDPGVFYVARGFGTENALYAPRSWTWGEYDDDIYLWRKHACQHTDPSNGRVPTGDLEPACVSAAIGHPDRTGSRETANAVVERYREYTDLSVRETVEELAERTPLSVRDEIERHGIDGSGHVRDGASLRYALSHRYVDSIELRVERAGQLKQSLSGFGRNPYLLDKADIYLEIEPGRSGNGERFRVDWEDTDGAQKKDTPQFDKHSGRHTSVYIDPNWDGDWLRLGQVQDADLVVEKPSRWALEEVQVTINGVVEHTENVNQVANANEVRIRNLLDNGY